MAIEEGLARLPEPPLAGLDVAHAIDRVRAARNAAPAAQATAPRTRLLRIAVPIGAFAASAFVLFQLNGGEGQEHLPTERTVANADAPAPLISVEHQPSELAIDLASAKAESPIADEGNGQVPSPPEDPVDDERLARARIEVRARLLSAYQDELAAHAGTGRHADFTSFAAAVDERTLPLRKQFWPILRTTEGLLKDGDPEVASAAARYVGLRGDRSSLRRLVPCLQIESMAQSVTLALADAGEDGLEGLALALSVPSQRSRASELLLAMDDPKVADRVPGLVAETLINELVSPTEESRAAASSSDLLDLLVALEPRSLPAILRLGHAGFLDREALLTTLDEIPSAGSYLSIAIREAGHPTRRRAGELETLLRCGTTLAPSTTGAWLDEAIGDRNWRDFCMEEFPKLRGIPGVEALVRLDRNSAISTSDLDDLFERALEIDPDRFIAALQYWRQQRVPKFYATVARRMLSLGTGNTIPVVRELLETDRVSVELETDLVAFLATHGSAADLPSAQLVFARCEAHEHQLAANALFAIHKLGGEDASTAALQGALPREQQNILLLLRRLEAEARTTSSLYKLARELRPLLSSRALATLR